MLWWLDCSQTVATTKLCTCKPIINFSISTYELFFCPISYTTKWSWFGPLAEWTNPLESNVVLKNLPIIKDPLGAPLRSFLLQKLIFWHPTFPNEFGNIMHSSPSSFDIQVSWPKQTQWQNGLPAAVAGIFLALAFELRDKAIHHLAVKVFTTQVCVTSCELRLKDIVLWSKLSHRVFFSISLSWRVIQKVSIFPFKCSISIKPALQALKSLLGNTVVIWKNSLF